MKARSLRRGCVDASIALARQARDRELDGHVAEVARLRAAYTATVAARPAGNPHLVVVRLLTEVDGLMLGAFEAWERGFAAHRVSDTASGNRLLAEGHDLRRAADALMVRVRAEARRRPLAVVEASS